MNTTRKVLFFAVVAFFSLTGNAANIPSDYQGTQELNQLNCVTEATQNCINNACLNSSDRNCETNCRNLAGDKCRLQNVN